MDRLRTLSDQVLLSFGLSSDSDKSKDEERIPEVIGKQAGSGSPELAIASNTGIDSQAVDNRSSEDESDDAFQWLVRFLTRERAIPHPMVLFHLIPLTKWSIQLVAVMESQSLKKRLEVTL